MTQLRADAARRLARGAAALALALALSYAESLLPPIGLPGAKLGIANLAVLFLLYQDGAGMAFAVSMLRVVMCAALFGGFSGFAMSASGALLSFAVMWPLCRVKALSPIGVSVAGAAAHNAAQVSAAALLAGSAKVYIYLPLLLLLCVPTGTVTGLACTLISARLNVYKAHKG